MLFVVLGIATIFSSCKKDDDGGSGSLLGTWKAVKETYTEKGITQTETYDDDYYELLIFDETTLTEKIIVDGVEDKGETDSFKYTLDGNRIMVKDGLELTYYGDYSLSGNTLTLTIDGADREESTTHSGYGESYKYVIIYKRQ